MDHGYIQEHEFIREHCVIERYHRGDLSPEEEERFEAHFLECVECREELEAERGFARGMKTVAAEEAARTAVRLGVLARLSRRGGVLAMAGLAVFAVGLAAGHLLRPGAPPVSLSVPLTDVPVVLLGVLRSEDEGLVVVTDRGGPWSLAVDAGADPRFESYTLTVLDAAGTPRWEGRDLRPSVLEVIQLTFPSGFLPPGDYRAVVDGVLPDGESVELGRYTFRLATP